MTDRELLELAAKAAGIATVKHPNNRISPRLLFIVDGKNWHPLLDDGDALRLAVLLRIDIKHYADHVVCFWNDYSGTGKVFYDLDSLAATRRAIVMTAAELGKERA